MQAIGETVRPGRLLTVREVAQLLHIHPNTVRMWSDRGLIPSYRIGSRGDRRFPEDDVLRLLNSSQRETKAFREMASEYLPPSLDSGVFLT